MLGGVPEGLRPLSRRLAHFARAGRVPTLRMFVHCLIMEFETLGGGVHRIGDATVNCYVLEHDDGIVMIDSGWPRSRSRLMTAFQAMGISPGDVRAVVLTHGDPDHVGCATWLQQEHGATLYAHPAEQSRVIGKTYAMPTGPITANLWRPTTVSFVATALRRGTTAVNWPVDVELSEPLPAGLERVPTPGHTEGHCSYLLPEHGMLFTGDALLTRNVFSGRTGPELHPILLDPDAALRSLAAIAEVQADVLLPGHGKLWKGAMADAASQAAASARR